MAPADGFTPRPLAAVLPDQLGACTSWDLNAPFGHPASLSMQQHVTGFFVVLHPSAALSHMLTTTTLPAAAALACSRFPCDAPGSLLWGCVAAHSPPRLCPTMTCRA